MRKNVSVDRERRPGLDYIVPRTSLVLQAQLSSLKSMTFNLAVFAFVQLSASYRGL
jgi:hypothetical protein